MSRIWVRVVKRHRALRETAAPCARDEVEERLRDVCREFDIPSPMWLDKQRGELERFGATAFARDNGIGRIIVFTPAGAEEEEVRG